MPLISSSSSHCWFHLSCGTHNSRSGLIDALISQSLLTPTAIHSPLFYTQKSTPPPANAIVSVPRQDIIQNKVLVTALIRVKAVWAQFEQSESFEETNENFMRHWCCSLLLNMCFIAAVLLLKCILHCDQLFFTLMASASASFRLVCVCVCLHGYRIKCLWRCIGLTLCTELLPFSMQSALDSATGSAYRMHGTLDSSIAHILAALTAPLTISAKCLGQLHCFCPGWVPWTAPTDRVGHEH